MHRAALGAGALSDVWADERLPSHVRRADFAFVVARAHSGLAGFGYGYTGARGQWWTDCVARCLEPALRAEWLDRPHYEVVELHVHPSQQRRGAGTLLLTELLERSPHERVLLTARTEAAQARSFYAKNGWAELAPVDFGAGYPPYLLLGRYLAESTTASRTRRRSRPRRSASASSDP